jgi:flagellar protein FliJ
MGQSIKTQSQFCITAALNEVSDPKRDFGHNNKAVESLNRARRVEIDDTRQRIAQVKAIVADFDRTANELEGWIRAEQNRTRIHDPAHFAYSTFAIAMTRRRDALKPSRETLRCSIDELQRQLSGADVTVESPISLRRRKPSP